MPIPTPNKNEDQSDYIGRCIKFLVDESKITDTKQQAAICQSRWRDSKSGRINKESGMATTVNDDEHHVLEYDNNCEVEVVNEILKTEEHKDHTFVLAPVLVPESRDKQGDIISAEVIELTAHKFIQNSGKAGFLHQTMLKKGTAVVVESYIQRTRAKVNGKIVKAGTWMAGMKVFDQKLRKFIREGKVKGFSIGGRGKGVKG